MARYACMRLGRVSCRYFLIPRPVPSPARSSPAHLMALHRRQHCRSPLLELDALGLRQSLGQVEVDSQLLVASRQEALRAAGRGSTQ